MCLCLCVCVCVYELRVYELGVYIRTCLHIHFQLWYMMPLRPLPNNYLVHKNLAYFCCVISVRIFKHQSRHVVDISQQNVLQWLTSMNYVSARRISMRNFSLECGWQKWKDM